MLSIQGHTCIKILPITSNYLYGGSYNVLLNTTSKRVAAFGAALGTISYLAIGVTSSVSAVSYFMSVVDGLPKLTMAIAVLLACAILDFFGIAESSHVALAIFMHHVVVLTVLVIASMVYVVQDTTIFRENMHSPLPDIDFAGTTVHSDWFTAIFFGFGASMLGITGFETSAQFVEEQKPGVFRKTLRNMWWFSSVYNPLIMVLALGVMPMESMYTNGDFLVAEMGEAVAGRWLKVWIAIDAFIVLTGSTLTSYVGITGLVRRLASDRVLPAFLMKQNAWRKTNHYIIFVYFLVASSLVLVLDGNVTTVGGVYTYAFLSVMALFSFGCMVLKTKRADIPRDIHAPWWSCIFGFGFVTIAILANLPGNPQVLMYFAFYVIAVVMVMAILLERVTILTALTALLAMLQSVLPSHAKGEAGSIESIQNDGHYESLTAPGPTSIKSIHTGARGGRTIAKAIMDINEAPIVFFCMHADMRILNKAIIYVRRNEQTHNLRIIHMANSSADGGESDDAVSVRNEFANIVALFHWMYPKLRIGFVNVQGDFEPAVVKWVSESLQVPLNMMFITQPGDKAVHSVSKLGVRVITG